MTTQKTILERELRKTLYKLDFAGDCKAFDRLLLQARLIRELLKNCK